MIQVDKLLALAWLTDNEIDIESFWQPREHENQGDVKEILRGQDEFLTGLDGRTLELLVESRDDGDAYAWGLLVPLPDGTEFMVTVHPSKVFPNTVNVEIDGDLSAGAGLRVHVNDALVLNTEEGDA